MSKNLRKKAFSLSELLIALGIIGVVGAILIATVVDITPDKGLAKFKKAYNTLQKGVGILTNSPLIYPNGNFNDIPSVADPSAYFCLHMADQLNTTGSITCTDTTKATTQVIAYTGTNGVNFDTACSNKPANVAFKTSDNIEWWGMRSNFSASALGANNMETNYTVICIDVTPEKPDIYSFGVRADGKVIPGAKAAADIEVEE